MRQDIHPVHVEQCLTDLRNKARRYRAAQGTSSEKAARTALHHAVVLAVQSSARQVQAARAAGLSTAQVSRLVRGASSGRTPLPPAQRWRHVIPAEDVIDRYRAGQSTIEIGRAYGCSKSTIASILEKNGVARRVGRLIQLPVANEELARRYLEGREQIQHLAAELEVKPNLISRRLAAAGVVVPVGSRRMDLPDAEIIERYKEGEPVRRIARSLGVSAPTIMQRIREGGALQRRRPRALTDEQRQQAVRLYQAGLSPRAVASKLGISRTTVRNAIEEAGVKRIAQPERARA